MIPFNQPCKIGTEIEAIQQVLTNNKFSGNGPFGKKCTDWFERELPCERAILTPSCTAALEMTALLTEVGEGDEVILPSYTFVSTANAFALRGASLRFVDVDPSTMNIAPDRIAAAVTDRTKAIVVVHYAGVSCDMDAIMKIANEHGLWVIEDAAQGVMSTYRGKALGTIGHLGTYSFHETKNYTSGEGGALIINDPSLIERAEILQEKGTDRSKFMQGMVDKYTWRDIGSSYLLSELNAAYLAVQLEHAELVNNDRLRTWEQYAAGLKTLIEEGIIEGPHIPEDCEHNAHMFYIKAKNEQERSELISYLKENNMMAVSHYVPLHTARAGQKFGKFIGKDRYTTSGSERIVRLPLYYGINTKDVSHVIETIKLFYQK
ncbi:dTDP-4-amino-4,6-dideoxygalactose transaminase [Oceanobacillus polygoni]|uniref:dTDP-4-amino-4,6-dideoxygalactose transaminase n=1 Tax=Oceanobacillus polygoni TaxID=1235259 RepID=A0A9X0YZB7_9BACI|nr:dTDP-4-amino-4,6-dideoxygalactose transaminase [Oceanobacillus polygoni]MBP2079490.1 dTDP-4-amino-4,6-dideoxygalactose transaminase [Oceanobacillus polygoni]